MYLYLLEILRLHLHIEKIDLTTQRIGLLKYQIGKFTKH
jgi:hypothetical protein